jgi:aryl-alcohol dehydrogenase-like predicted oxidoreductase
VTSEEALMGSYVGIDLHRRRSVIVVRPGENFQRNLRIVDEVQAIATEAGATPAQIALAWLLAQGDDVAPIPGTRRVARVGENTAADGIELSGHQLDRLNHLTPAAGKCHNEASMAAIDR